MFVTIFVVFLDIFWLKTIASRDGCVLLKNGLTKGSFVVK